MCQLLWTIASIHIIICQSPISTLCWRCIYLVYNYSGRTMFDDDHVIMKLLPCWNLYSSSVLTYLHTLSYPKIQFKAVGL